MLPILMFMLYTQIILVMLEVFGKDQRLRFWSLIDSVPIMMLMRQLESLCGLASARPNGYPLSVNGCSDERPYLDT